MRRFGYICDRLFLFSATAYALNRGLLKTVIQTPFMLGHFNDLLLIPAALPVVLAVQRLAGMRLHDLSPSWIEMALHLTVWSVICEFIGPVWLGLGTADFWDVVMYLMGGVGACLWWNRPSQAQISGGAL